MNWITGVILLLCTIFMGFTGQLLRWDSDGVWSSVVAAEQLGRIPLIGKQLSYLLIGGETIGGQSLSRFYSYHVFVFPALILSFIAFHVYLVFKNGISEPPKAGRPVDPKTYRSWYEKYLKEKSVPFWPNAAWRDVLFSSLVILLIVTLAVTVGAPALTGPPDPSQLNTSPRPDWYMVPFFALFALMPHSIESAAMVLGPILTILFLFSIPFLSNKGERSPIRRPWALFGVALVTVSVLSLLYIGIKAPWSADFTTTPLPVSAVQSSGADSIAIKGVALFYNKGCQYCHTINEHGGKSGPELTNVGNRLSQHQIMIRIVNGAEDMPAFGSVLSKKELEELSAFLVMQK
jgi:ubiquinol-cytochrome c reductase cytochrome b subunit